MKQKGILTNKFPVQMAGYALPTRKPCNFPSRSTKKQAKLREVSNLFSFFFFKICFLFVCLGMGKVRDAGGSESNN